MSDSYLILAQKLKLPDLHDTVVKSISLHCLFSEP